MYKQIKGINSELTQVILIGTFNFNLLADHYDNISLSASLTFVFFQNNLQHVSAFVCI